MIQSTKARCVADPRKWFQERVSVRSFPLATKTISLHCQKPQEHTAATFGTVRGAGRRETMTRTPAAGQANTAGRRQGDVEENMLFKGQK